MTDTTETVILKSGVEVPLPLVVITWRTLQRLMQAEPLTLFDAVETARTGQPQSFSAARLEDCGLTQGGRMHDGTRDIILAAAVGDGFDLRLVNPIAP